VYSETDFTEVRGQLKKVILLSAGILLVFIILTTAFLLRQPQWIGATVLSAGVCLAVFIWGVFGTPTYSYYHYIKDIAEGRTREMKGSVVKLTDTPVYKDNRLLFYEVLVKDQEDGIEKVLLFDENKGKPELHIGRAYTFRTHQNFIIHLEES
jgi:hypothetical protein